MHKLTVAIVLAGLMLASPVAAKTAAHPKTAAHHHRSHSVHHRRKHKHHRRKHKHHRRKHRPVKHAPATAPAAASSTPVRLIGVGNPPGCLNGANPTPYIREYGATVLRIVLSPYYGAAGTTGSAIPCLRAAIADGARVQIAIQWRSVWSTAQAAAFVREELSLYAPYVWAVGLGNEQDLWWNLPWHPFDTPQTAAQYAADWDATEPILAQMAPRAVRVAIEASPWSYPFSKQVLAYGLPGAQALAYHPYTVPAGYPTVNDFYNLAATYGMPLWCTEGLNGPGVMLNPRFPPQSLAQLAPCQVAVAWLM
jgi:Ni/Co efflux regulator RcnB